MKERSLKGALISIAIVEALAFLSNLLAGDIRAVYETLIKPPLSPPGWLFGLVWPVLYALIGIAGYLIYTINTQPEKRHDALEYFSWQLALNLIWPICFFRLELFWTAAFIILILDVLVVLTIYSFRRLDKTAAILLIPYLLWILFATYLNIGFAILNY